MEKSKDLRKMTRSERRAHQKNEKEEEELPTETTVAPSSNQNKSVAPEEKQDDGKEELPTLETSTIQLDEQGFVIIDGSLKEGGGQILRNSMSLSALLKKPIKIINIRAGRNSGGLKAQHLTGIELVSEIYNGTLVGASASFNPGDYKEGKFTADTQTAGAISLLIQVSLPVMVFGGKKTVVDMKGGTNVPFSPQIDYMHLVFQPVMEQFGVTFNIDIKHRGYFPKGGGQVTLSANPVKQLKPINMVDRGTVVSVHCRAFVAGTIPLAVGEQMANQAMKTLHKYFGPKNTVKFDFELLKEGKSTGNGVGLILYAKTSTGCILGASDLGEKGVTSEKVGAAAANRLIFNLKKGGCVDEFLQDQLILFCALAPGKSKFKSGPLTLHTETSIYFAQMLTGAKFTVTKTPLEEKIHADERSFIIECEGVGFVNKYLK